MYSDYIVFADESGSPVLDGVDPTFPIFALACVLVRKEIYVDQIVPALQRLKFDFVGHDQLILHERDIRRNQNDFAFLQVDATRRAAFLDRINQIVAEAEIEVIAAVIEKNRLNALYADPWSPYELALHFCMERILQRLRDNGQDGRLVHVVFEGRGAKEDRELELCFRRISNNEEHWGYVDPTSQLCAGSRSSCQSAAIHPVSNWRTLWLAQSDSRLSGHCRRIEPLISSSLSLRRTG